MRITFITTLMSYWGGCEPLWVKTAELAVAKGHQVQIVIYKQKERIHPSLENLCDIVDSSIKLDNDLLSLSLAERGLRALRVAFIPKNLHKVSQFNPDCILISQAYNYDVAFNELFYSFVQKSTTPFFLISHFNFEHKGLSYADIVKARKVITKAEVIFFVSLRNKQVTERQIAMKVVNAKYTGNPLNLTNNTYIPYSVKEGRICFASVARLEVNMKGQDILLQVFSGPNWKTRNWHLNIYGEGPDEKYLKELVGFYGLQGRVTFHGHVTNIHHVWENNHALLMPSTSEGKPLVIGEAMICGRTVVATDVAGHVEIIDDGVTGYIASSFFPKPFEEALERAWNNREAWEAMGLSAHKRMISSLDLNPQETLLNLIETHQ